MGRNTGVPGRWQDGLGEDDQDVFAEQQHARQAAEGGPPEEEIEVGEELDDRTMLDSVILPIIASLFPRVSTNDARKALSNLQKAFADAEQIIPGLANEFVNEIVDSVEHVEEEV